MSDTRLGGGADLQQATAGRNQVASGPVPFRVGARIGEP